jgi:tetratricopeptide (TPR) repeat protein
MPGWYRKSYSSGGMLLEAGQSYRSALKIYEGLPHTEVNQATCHLILWGLYKQKQEFNEANLVLNRALDIYAQNPQGTEEIHKICVQLLDQLS